MRLALVGYGKMGRAIEALAPSRGHEVALVTGRRSGLLDLQSLTAADVCLEFTHPSSVLNTIRLLLTVGKPLVIGTTGWDAHLDDVRRLVEDSGVGVVYGPNYALGVNFLYRLTRYAGQLMQHFPQFGVGISEEHHQHKADSPSGTALVLRAQLPPKEPPVPIASLRCGAIPGTHQVIWDASDETVTLTHTSRSRNAFATGALVAAEWIQQRRGFFSVDEMIDSFLKQSPVALV